MIQAFARTTLVLNASRAKVVGTFLASELLEEIRNLAYTSVGVEGSVPDGVLKRTEEHEHDSFSFTITNTVRNIDDPFDGTLGSTTAPDSAPADYKLVEVKVDCELCANFNPIVLTTTIAPKSLEAPEEGGGILVKVFDASGQALSGATVDVSATIGGDTITIQDITDVDGLLSLIGLPTAVEKYNLIVNKSGYSTDRTYPPGGVGNPNPTKSDVTVATGTATVIGFAIDKVSSLTVRTRDDICTPIADVNFDLSGSKKIGHDPDVFKFGGSFSTDGDGNKSWSTLEWDEYTTTLTDIAYDLAGTIPFSPFSLSPNASQDLFLILKPKSAKSLLIRVKDSATGLPITGASVAISDGVTSYTKDTGRGAKGQGDWSGGAGQATSSSAVESRYFSQDGNVDTASPMGSLRLTSTFGEYAESGELVSSAFDTETQSTFYTLTWSPSTQPLDAGDAPIKVQLASNLDGGEWNFVGPDGTAETYYTSSGETLSSVHDGDRYMRYKITMESASTTTTPSISDISFLYSTDCTPPGLVFWSGLSGGEWEIDATHPEYILVEESINLDNDWQEKVLSMTRI